MSWLLETTNFTARKFCVVTNSHFQYSAMAAELMTGAAYFFIAGVLCLTLYRRPNLIPTRIGMALFGAFILLCGIGHVLDAFLWERPWYNLWLLSRWATGIVSFVTMLAMHPIYKHLIRLRSSAEYHDQANKTQVAYNKEAAARLTLEKINKNLKREIEIMRLRLDHIEWRFDKREEVEGLKVLLEKIEKAGDVQQ